MFRRISSRITLGVAAAAGRLVLAVGAVLAAAAAVLALVGVTPLGIALTVVAVVVVVLGFVADHELKRQRKADAVNREITEALRVPVGPVVDIDPTQIGVAQAARGLLPGEPIPTYVSRKVDSRLQTAVQDAITAADHWIVAVRGQSKTGKSRSLFEALVSVSKSTPLTLMAPLGVDGLKRVTSAAAASRQTGTATVLWLEDIQGLVNKGLTFRLLADWRATVKDGLVAATIGPSGSGAAVSADSGIATLYGEINSHARIIDLSATTADEIEPLRARLSDHVIASLERYGVASYLIAAPLLEDKLMTHRQPRESGECPGGAAVVQAAIDWARCGRTDGQSRSDLRSLRESYMHTDNVGDDFEVDMDWALRPVEGRIALLRDQGDGYVAFDYIVQFVAKQPNAPPPPSELWAKALVDVADELAFAVGTAAYGFDLHGYATRAWRIASQSLNEETAASATVNLGVLSEGTREGVAFYDNVIERFSDRPETGLRKAVALAFFNKGVSLEVMGRLDEEMAAYQEVIVRFEDTKEEELCDPLARALFYTGLRMSERGRPEEALPFLTKVIARFGDRRDVALSRRVAKALVEKGGALDRLHRHDEAIDTYDIVVERFKDADTPEMLQPLGDALLAKGAALERLGRISEAAAVYRDTIHRFNATRMSSLVSSRGVAIGLSSRAGRAHDRLARLERNEGSAS